MNVLSHISDIIIPLLLFYIVGYGVVSRVKVYEAFLTIWTKEVLHVFLEVVRVENKQNGKFEYGAIFIGMSEMDASRIETYGTIQNMNV